MNFVRRTWAICTVASRRLFAQRGLALATATGLVVSIAIVMSIPLYTDAVYYQILQDELAQGDDDALQRPPFAFMFRYIGTIYGLKEWEDLQDVDAYLTTQAPTTLGLPHKETVRYMRTDNFRLFPADQTAYDSVADPLEWISFATAGNLADHITLLEGLFPTVASNSIDEPVPVLISEALADELGIQVGERYVTFRTTTVDGNRRTAQIPVIVSGIWRANDATEEYWFYRQSVFDNQFFVPEETMVGRIAALLNDEVAQMLWYIILDGSEVNADGVNRLINRIRTVQQRVGTLLANTQLEISPQDALIRYSRSARLLNILLYAFSIPIIGLLLAFIGLVVGLSVNRQRNEIAVLRSRGATVLQIIGIAAVEALILGLIALIISLPVSRWIAQMIGATRSFLNFTTDVDLRIAMTTTALRFGLVAVVVTLVAQIIPTIGAAHHTIISYKQEQARTVRLPWWQRAWLDLLLLIPVLYGTYLLRQQEAGDTGGVGIRGGIIGNSGGPFDNPLLFLIPALGALALTLLTLRILPILIRGIAWLASKTESVGFLLATRYLSRDPGFYAAPLVLLILTLSLSTFTASLARTLDNHLYDQIYYKTGADTWLVELGTTNSSDSSAPGGRGGGSGSSTGSAADGDSVIEEARWVFIPVDEHLKIDGIQAATRVGDFKVRIQAQGSWQEATLIGIDRIGFPKVAFWRSDFARASLGAMMNALAVAPDGLLVSREFMRQRNINVGDSVVVRISSYGQRAEATMKVVGDFRYFPTWYEAEDGPLLIGNLENIFEEMGGMVPYDVWIKTDPGVDYTQLLDGLRKLNLNVLNWRASRITIAEEQKLPQRQGLFGVLSVGFLAAALLTVLGFLLYALFSFRRRFIELGTLRAIGLSAGQMATFLAWELIFLIFIGLGAGTLLGTLMSNIYIPYLQVGADPVALTPPFLVEIAWPAIVRIYLLFGLLFLWVLGILAVLLLRMKIFQAIKLGETV